MELDDWCHPYRDKLAPCHSACGLARSGQGRRRYSRLQTNILIPRPSNIPRYTEIKTILEPVLLRGQQPLQHVRELMLTSKHCCYFVLQHSIDRHTTPGLTSPIRHPHNLLDSPEMLVCVDVPDPWYMPSHYTYINI